MDISTARGYVQQQLVFSINTALHVLVVEGDQRTTRKELKASEKNSAITTVPSISNIKATHKKETRKG